MINVNFTDGVEVITSSTHLYQWDSNQEITISGLNVVNASVHFTTKKRNDAIVVTGTKDGDNLIADIPNILLEDDCDIIAYVHVVANNKGNTIKIVKIPKLIRQKPSDYQFTDNVQIMTFERLENDFNDLSNEVHEKILDLDSYCSNLTQETRTNCSNLTQETRTNCNQILANANEEVKKIENNYEIELNTKAEIEYVDSRERAILQNVKSMINEDVFSVRTVSEDFIYVSAGGTADVTVYTGLDIDEKIIGLTGYNVSNASMDGYGGSYGMIYKVYPEPTGSYFNVSIRNIHASKEIGVKVYLYILVAKELD